MSECPNHGPDRNCKVVQELRERIKALEKDKALLIKDLRETWDYQDEHITEVLSAGYPVGGEG